jgi:hypothetical protein
VGNGEEDRIRSSEEEEEEVKVPRDESTSPKFLLRRMDAIKENGKSSKVRVLSPTEGPGTGSSGGGF